MRSDQLGDRLGVFQQVLGPAVQIRERRPANVDAQVAIQGGKDLLKMNRAVLDLSAQARRRADGLSRVLPPPASKAFETCGQWLRPVP